MRFALYQTKIWNKVINDINLNDYKVKIIILDTESKNYLRKNRSFIDASNILKNNKSFTISDIKNWKGKINNINHVLKHEKVFYGKEIIIKSSIII